MINYSKKKNRLHWKWTNQEDENKLCVLELMPLNVNNMQSEASDIHLQFMNMSMLTIEYHHAQ